jgi:hypothetical protein
MQVATFCIYYGVPHCMNVGVVWMKVLQLEVNKRLLPLRINSIYSKTKDSVVLPNPLHE